MLDPVAFRIELNLIRKRSFEGEEVDLSTFRSVRFVIFSKSSRQSFGGMQRDISGRCITVTIHILPE